MARIADFFRRQSQKAQQLREPQRFGRESKAPPQTQGILRASGGSAVRGGRGGAVRTEFGSTVGNGPITRAAGAAAPIESRQMRDQPLRSAGVRPQYATMAARPSMPMPDDVASPDAVTVPFNPPELIGEELPDPNIHEVNEPLTPASYMGGEAGAPAMGEEMPINFSIDEPIRIQGPRYGDPTAEDEAVTEQSMERVRAEIQAKMLRELQRRQDLGI
jgi:hypothetical protein